MVCVYAKGKVDFSRVPVYVRGLSFSGESAGSAPFLLDSQGNQAFKMHVYRKIQERNNVNTETKRDGYERKSSVIAVSFRSYSSPESEKCCCKAA